MSHSRKVSLFRNGRNQAIRIPVEFELAGDEAIIRRQGDELIITPVRPKTDALLFLRERSPPGPADEFPDIDADHLPQREIEL